MACSRVSNYISRVSHCNSKNLYIGCLAYQESLVPSYVSATSDRLHTNSYEPFSYVRQIQNNFSYATGCPIIKIDIESSWSTNGICNIPALTKSLERKWTLLQVGRSGILEWNDQCTRKLMITKNNNNNNNNKNKTWSLNGYMEQIRLTASRFRELYDSWCEIIMLP